MVDFAKKKLSLFWKEVYDSLMLAKEKRVPFYKTISETTERQ